MQKVKKIDTLFITLVAGLLIFGVVFFLSAALGIYAKNQKLFLSIILNQFALGVGGGLILFFIGFKIPYLFWKKHAFIIFIGSLILMIGVFIPGLGFEHGGARRWITIGFTTFQPAEILKIAFIIYFSAWVSWVRKEINSFKKVIIPFFILLAIMGTLLFLQPDTKSFILMTLTGMTMLFISGTPIKHFITIFVIGAVTFVSLAMTTPYIQKRIQTFLNPSHDVQGSSYQLKQAFIAFGSGGMFGQGIGQSVQKFGYLPEAHGDSIFAVIGEETGFIGTCICILLYIAFILRGLRISYHAQDPFARLLSLGIIIILGAQSFLNIASLIGLFPLTGVPLVFISHGGTSLALSLFAVGIVTQISQFKRSDA
jgi:cell division protein FtsW